MGVKSYILYGNPQKERARGTKKKSVGISRICDVNTYPTDPTDFFWSPSRKTFLETCIKYISLYPHCISKWLFSCLTTWREGDKEVTKFMWGGDESAQRADSHKFCTDLSPDRHVGDTKWPFCMNINSVPLGKSLCVLHRDRDKFYA